ncbi:MAG: hypothetical protein R6V07_05445, partial [Armatimonadota bacterium]
LQESFDLTRVDLFAHTQEDESRRLSSAQLFVSETGEDGSFVPVGEIPDAPSAELGAEGQYVFEFDASARYIRIVASKKGTTMVLGEVRIWAEQ